MASSIIRRRWFGWANPNAPVQAGAKTATGTTIVLGGWNPVLRSSPQPFQTLQYRYTINGVNLYSVVNAVVSGGGATLTLTVSQAMVAGQAITVTYVPGPDPTKWLVDSQGDAVSKFTVAITAT